MIVETARINRTFFWGKLNRANPYATTAAEQTAPIVLKIAYTVVLRSSLKNLICCQALV